MFVRLRVFNDCGLNSLIQSQKLLIKIDVQGFEHKVLMSGIKFINKKVPLIIEFDRSFLKGENANKILRLFKKNYNYISLIDNKNVKKEKIENIEKIFSNLKKNWRHFNCLIH